MRRPRGVLTKSIPHAWAACLLLAAASFTACEAAETSEADTDSVVVDTESASESDDSMSGEDSSGGGAPPIEVGAPSNVRGADESGCQQVGEEWPDAFVFATCVGDPIPTIEGSSEWCEDGPKPFGAMALATTSSGSSLIFCSGGDADFFNFGDDYPYAIAVAYSDGDTSSVDALALSASGGSYDVRCDPEDGFGSQTVDAGAFPVGEFTCGSMTVVSADPGQAPIVRVGPEDSPTYLQMVAL